MSKVSIIIPSRNEEFLTQTVDDIFNKARGDFEVIVICDETYQPQKPRPNLKVVQKDGAPGLRSAINQGIALSTGKYVMKVDGHCMFGEGFDTILSENCDEDWVVIPRRYSLVPEEWAINIGRPTIDYEYLVFPFVPLLHSVRTGGKWYQRAIDRAELMLDENMAFQGSCWFAPKEHILRVGGFQVNTSTGDEFVLESEELANKTWLSGGKVMTNKRTWYAHLHKGKRGRGYFLNKWPMRRQRIFHIDYWMHNKWPQAIRPIEWLIDYFWPVPGWPEDWKTNPIYEQTYLNNLNMGKYPAEM